MSSEHKDLASGVEHSVKHAFRVLLEGLTPGSNLRVHKRDSFYWFSRQLRERLSECLSREKGFDSHLAPGGDSALLVLEVSCTQDLSAEERVLVAESIVGFCRYHGLIIAQEKEV